MTATEAGMGRPAEPAGETAGARRDLLLAARSLAPSIAERAEALDAARRLPVDLVDQLDAAGFLRMLLPESHGGAALELPRALAVFDELARADASVAWTVALGATVWCDLVGLPRRTFDELYGPASTGRVAGVFAPAGTAVPDDAGYRVDGRWAFASGCTHSTWLYGNCVEPVDGEPRVRTVVFRRDDVEIEDTWHSLGLRGTGSHHFHAAGVTVAGERTFATFEAEPCLDVPLVRVPQPVLFALEIAAVAVGAARGALDELGALAETKVPLLASGPLADQPVLHLELATADTALRAAQALLQDEATAVWEGALRGSVPDLRERAQPRAAAAWAVGRAADVVTAAHRMAGGSAVDDGGALVRRFRDVHTITQHFLVKPATLATAGAALAGREVSDPVF